MKPTPKPTTDGLAILHQTLYRGHPDRLAALEQVRLDDDMGRRLRTLREDASLTQAQLARRLRVTARFVDDLEEAAIEANYLRWLQALPNPLCPRAPAVAARLICQADRRCLRSADCQSTGLEDAEADRVLKVELLAKPRSRRLDSAQISENGAD